MVVLFCDNLIDRKVDPDFEEEHAVATAHSIPTSLISFETLNEGNVIKALSRIRPQENLTPAVYRGWMMTPAVYELFYEELLTKNISLINDPEAYRACHYLPDSYAFIEDSTPATKWMPLEGPADYNKIFELTSQFGHQPIIVKDYVKSQKHNWKEACFIPDASDQSVVQRVVSRFIGIARLRIERWPCVQEI